MTQRYFEDFAVGQRFGSGRLVIDAAATMRLLVESDMKPAGAIVGAGFDAFRCLQPVRPGDVLRIESEIVARRPPA